MMHPFSFFDCFCPPSEVSPFNPSSSSSCTHGNLNFENLHVFSYNDLKIATNGFRSSNKIGSGAFGSVYKGRLRDGTLVAIKVLSVELDSLRGEREFISEVSALTDIKHQYLVPFRGCCIDGSRRLLVYDYMENNSLALTLLGSLQNRQKFSWEARRDISLGVARALAYLHDEVQPSIVHRDIKSSNVLLDQDFKPRLTDFGLSRLFRSNDSHISTCVAGTLGYLAPEYALSGHLTRKSDVYSFGVLLLEVVSGQPVIHLDLEHGESYLVQKAWEHYKTNSLLQLVDPALEQDFQEEEAARFLKVGLLCVQESARRRPHMPAAEKMLANELDIDNIQISKPGLIANLRDIKVERNAPGCLKNASACMTPHTPFTKAIKFLMDLANGIQGARHDSDIIAIFQALLSADTPLLPVALQNLQYLLSGSVKENQ